MSKKFGELTSDKIAKDNLQCREIVREIGNFGVSERQRIFLIYLLALELENNELMRNISSVIRESNSELLISDKAE